MHFTEEIYKRLKKWVLVCCVIGILVYVFLIKWLAKVNPDAFIYNPMTDDPPALFYTHKIIVWAVVFSWVVMIILYIRESRMNPDHWINKIGKTINEQEGGNENGEENNKEQKDLGEFDSGGEAGASEKET